MKRKSNTHNIYAERIMLVLNYIQKHLDEKPDLEQLAKITFFSPFHFHRIFKAFTGENVAGYIRRLKIERAASDLKYSDKKVGLITLEAGYENTASFSRIFKKKFGKTPIEYRKESKEELQISFEQRMKEIIFENLKVKIINDLPDRKLVCKRHLGNYAEVDATWNALMKWTFKNKYVVKNTIGISYDNPNITEEEKIRYDACVELEKEHSPEGNLHELRLKGGKYAVATIKGPYDTLDVAYDYIYIKWLAAHKLELRNEPCFEIYKNMAPENTPDEYVTELYFPVV